MLVHLPRAELLRLAEPSAERCVSIYLPVGASGGHAAAKRLRQILRELQDQIEGQGLASATSAQLLGAVGALAGELEIRANDHAPLVILARRDDALVARLPGPVPELAVYGPRLHLKPLLPLAAEPAAYYLLALGKGGVRLFRGVGVALEPLALPGAPESVDALLESVEFEPQRQLHPGVPGKGGARGAVFHGQGDAADHLKSQLRRYCQQVDRALLETVGTSRTPLVLCGVDYLLAIYRACSRYPMLADEAIYGSPGRLTPAQLGEWAWAIVRPRAEQALSAAFERYAAGAHSAERVCTVLRQLLPAAAAGQVDTAFVALDWEQWGRYDAATGHVLMHKERQPGDEDLLNVAALETLRHGGDAYALLASAVPGGELSAAILRPSGVAALRARATAQ